VNLEEIRKIASDNMMSRRSHLEREPGYIYYHGLRTANLAAEILNKVEKRGNGRGPTFDPVLYTGALFHDIGKGFVSHHETGAELARRLLDGVCSDNELDRICDITRFHCIRKSGFDLDKEILAVQDADIIDHFGTQEIWLNFLNRGYKHEGQLEAIRFWDSDFFRDHTAKLRSLLNFEISKKLYDDRLEFQRLFLDRFKLEAEGLIPKEVAGEIT
jgi:uncharacterized protein